MSKFPLRGLIIGAVIVGLVIFVVSQMQQRNSGETHNISYFLQQVEQGKVREIQVQGSRLIVTDQGGSMYTTRTGEVPSLQQQQAWVARGIEVENGEPERNWGGALMYLLPILLMVGFLVYLMRGARTYHRRKHEYLF
jgi:cell division protease FtsH